LPWPVTIAAATAASWIERPEKDLALEKLHATAGILESKEDDREKKWLPGEGDEEEEEEEEEEEQEEEEEEDAAEASCGNTAVRLCAMAAAAVARRSCSCSSSSALRQSARSKQIPIIHNTLEIGRLHG
jgi:aconitase A